MLVTRFFSRKKKEKAMEPGKSLKLFSTYKVMSGINNHRGVYELTKNRVKRERGDFFDEVHHQQPYEDVITTQRFVIRFKLHSLLRVITYYK